MRARFVAGPLVIVLLGLNAFSSPSYATTKGGTNEPWRAAPSFIVREVTEIPGSVFNEVGLQPDVTPPVVLHSQPLLKFQGKPGIYYLGNEPCPLCAAERWAFIAATARFGTWSHLGVAASASNDEYPNTQSFTFARASFRSTFITVATVEHLGSHELANGDYDVLQEPTRQEARLYSLYDTVTYFPSDPGTYPFVDFGDQVVVAGPSYDPSLLHGLSRVQIAAALATPTRAPGREILATANYLAAAICSIDGERPSAVCTSTGVAQATHFDKIPPFSPLATCSAKPETSQAVCGSRTS